MKGKYTQGMCAMRGLLMAHLFEIMFAAEGETTGYASQGSDK